MGHRLLTAAMLVAAGAVGSAQPAADPALTGVLEKLAAYVAAHGEKAALIPRRPPSRAVSLRNSRSSRWVTDPGGSASAVIPAGSAEPVRRFLMAARTGSSAAILLNGAEVDTSALPPGRYTASVVALIANEPVGRVSRAFEVLPAR